MFKTSSNPQDRASDQWRFLPGEEQQSRTCKLGATLDRRATGALQKEVERYKKEKGRHHDRREEARGGEQARGGRARPRCTTTIAGRRR
jgi:hypothetical protein